MDSRYLIVVRWLVVTWAVMMVNLWAFLLGALFQNPQVQGMSVLLGAVGGAGLAWWAWWTNRQQL